MQIYAIFLNIFKRGKTNFFLYPYEKSDDTFLYQTDPALSNGAISRILGSPQLEFSRKVVVEKTSQFI